jgi:hypothetical protein
MACPYFAIEPCSDNEPDPTDQDSRTAFPDKDQSEPSRQQTTVPPLATAVAYRLTGPCPDLSASMLVGRSMPPCTIRARIAYSIGAAFRSGTATLHRGAPRGEAVQIVNRAKADPAYSAGVANALGLAPLEVTAE